MPFGLQPLDIIVIVVVALVIFGPKRLPQLGRWLGKTFASLRKGARDLADGFAQETRSQGNGPAPASPAGSVPDASGAEPAAGASTARSPAPASEPGPEASCTACGAANPAGSRFCNRCGTRLPS